MNGLIFKIEQTLDLVVPLAVVVLAALNLTGVVALVDKWVPIGYALLGVLGGVFKIWGLNLRVRAKKAAELAKKG